MPLHRLIEKFRPSITETGVQRTLDDSIKRLQLALSRHNGTDPRAQWLHKVGFCNPPDPEFKIGIEIQHKGVQTITGVFTMNTDDGRSASNKGFRIYIEPDGYGRNHASLYLDDFRNYFDLGKETDMAILIQTLEIHAKANAPKSNVVALSFAALNR